MSVKTNIGKMAWVLLWCLVGGGVLVLLVAAMNRKNSRTCKSYRVEINDGQQRLFIDQKSVINLLTDNGSEKLTGKIIAGYDLRKMEETIRRNPWVSDVQLFFDSHETLRIKIRERKPVARIFTLGGNSFFIDSGGTQLPLPEQSAIRLPVFTGFPAEKIRIHGPDSALVQDIRKLSQYIQDNPFWMADIEQVAITPRKTFEMVPVIGNHLIEFGNGDNYQDKFQKLFVFYREVSAKTGFDKYSKLDLQYEGQVIGTRRGSYASRYDSLQAMRNIQQLIRASQQMQADTVRQSNIKPLEHNTITEQTLTGYDLVSDEEDSSASNKKKSKK